MISIKPTSPTVLASLRLVTLSGNPVPLKPTEYELLDEFSLETGPVAPRERPESGQAREHAFVAHPP